MKIYISYIISIFIFFLLSCGHHRQKPLFKLLPSSLTDVYFSNNLTEDSLHNLMKYEYFYNGGGVAIGDLNGDGLPDIYFTGNMVSNKLYLNEGHMRFKDVTDEAGVAGRKNGWKTGVTLADVNGDGLLDIYVCYSGNVNGKLRENQLFINQGVDKNGIPHFKEEAFAYGLADSGYSTQAVFFDMDHDGDLDCFVLNHSIKTFSIQQLIHNKDSIDVNAGNHLYENINGHFVDVTKKEGIISNPIGYGLSVSVADVNDDGWDDIYVSNDYNEKDYLYFNDGTGKHFHDQILYRLGHISYFSMGSDIADINQDALPDIFTLDMFPPHHVRRHLLYMPDDEQLQTQMVRAGFGYQIMRNMLQLNNGNGTFSEIGQLAGVSSTDWSWCPLLADFDNDGWKDIFVSTGYFKDNTNMDYLSWKSNYLLQQLLQLKRPDTMEMLKHMPSTPLHNFIFQNDHHLHFIDQSLSWGFNKMGFSNGAAYADLDNDGDLDLVVNNINGTASIYQNMTSEYLHRNFLAIHLDGTSKNRFGIGTKVYVYTGHEKQYMEQMLTRGFESSVSEVLHFGLGKYSVVDSLRVIWPSGRTQLLMHVPINQTITLHEQEAQDIHFSYSQLNNNPIFTPTISPIDFIDQSYPFDDFSRQPLLYQSLSNVTPTIDTADVNGDGLFDLYVGGGQGQVGSLYIQKPDGGFSIFVPTAFLRDALSTDVASVFFDANGDGYPDLYVVSGGYNQYAPDDSLLQDRLYINDGKGNFTRSALPYMHESKSCVAVADMNHDGYSDLFVGGRVIPGEFPETPENYLLINDGKGHFKNMIDKLAPGLKKIGMVTDAVWADLNRDGWPDLVVVGEFMPISVFINHHGNLVNETSRYFDRPYSGLWNCVCVKDINGDGYPDIIAGNLGINSWLKASVHKPLTLLYKDFDQNGTIDPILCMYDQDGLYPVATRDELIRQIPFLEKKFPTYQSYAQAKLQGIFNKQQLQNAKTLEANTLQTMCFLYKKHRFMPIHLPIQAQFSPVWKIISVQDSHSKHLSLLLLGNQTDAQIIFGRFDANEGIFIQQDEDGSFKYVPQYQSGLLVHGNIRAACWIKSDNKWLLLIGANHMPLQAYELNKPFSPK
ncbi:MAG: VCBS repeat-containing protein [Thermoflavifilum sp.]|nr:VCBS repeat-containing protein [Thermoflavifilum sp.]